MNPTERIRVLLVDDHAVVRAGLRAILEGEPDIEVVAETGDGLSAVELYREHLPDVAVMDLRMPVLDGIAALARIRAAHPAARVLLLSTYDDEEDVCRGIEAGALGYMLKDSAPAELVQSVRRVSAGRRAIAPEAAERLAGRVAQRELSDRELEVLRLLAEGRSNKQIAKALGIADGTVKVHVANILDKLGVQGRSEAVAQALRRGLVRLD